MNQEQRAKKAEQLRLAAQIIETGVEWETFSIIRHKWMVLSDITDPVEAIRLGYEIRIKEPVIPVPEGWRELRDDEKDGRWIEGAKWLNGEGLWGWAGVHRAGAFAIRTQRIIVPVAKPRVPLEPCDVPPGSVIDLKHGEEGWNLILVASKEGITVLDKNNHPQDYTFEELMEGHFESRIKRPTDTEWQPCSKEAP